jgi:hypothetical protein
MELKKAHVAHEGPGVQSPAHRWFSTATPGHLDPRSGLDHAGSMDFAQRKATGPLNRSNRPKNNMD